MKARPNQEIEELYRAHRDRLWRALYLYAGDRELAADAVAEAFAQALARGDAIRSVLPWVWRAAFRIAAGELKGAHRPVPGTPEQPYEVPAEATELAEALSRLPLPQRAIVVLRYYADLPVREVARIVGGSPPAVAMQLTRARRRLRAILEVDDD